MRDLLDAVRGRLSRSLSGLHSGAVYLAPDPGWIPGAVNPPCVGICPGGTEYAPRRGHGQNRDATMKLRLAVYGRLLRDADVYLEDDGVLALVERVETALDGGVDILPGLAAADVTAAGPVELYGDAGTFLHRVVLEITYRRIETRPAYRA